MTHPKQGGVQNWEETDVADTLNAFDNSESRTPILIAKPKDAGCFKGLMGAKAGNIGFVRGGVPDIGSESMRSCCDRSE